MNKQPVFLTEDDVQQSHVHQIATYGGTLGVRDIGLLKSANAQPSATFDGRYLHADLYEMAAAYLYHLAQNHPYIDGNKRIALVSALIFLEINQVQVEASDAMLYELVMMTAQGQVEKSQIAEFFRLHHVC